VLRLVGVSMVESVIARCLALILLHSARVGQALLPVLSMAKGEQARVPVLLVARRGGGQFDGKCGVA